MGGHARQVRARDHQAVNPKLAELINSGQFDWDNDTHREAYLRAWVNGAAPPPDPEKEADA